jgi:hypothetical protein
VWHARADRAQQAEERRVFIRAVFRPRGMNARQGDPPCKTRYSASRNAIEASMIYGLP